MPRDTVSFVVNYIGKEVTTCYYYLMETLNLLGLLTSLIIVMGLINAFNKTCLCC